MRAKTPTNTAPIVRVRRLLIGGDEEEDGEERCEGRARAALPLPPRRSAQRRGPQAERRLPAHRPHEAPASDEAQAGARDDASRGRPSELAQREDAHDAAPRALRRLRSLRLPPG